MFVSKASQTRAYPRFAMGTAASTAASQPSSRFLQVRVDQLKERELEDAEDGIKRTSDMEEAVNEKIKQLHSEKEVLLEMLRQSQQKADQLASELQREKSKSLALMLSELPLHLLNRKKPIAHDTDHSLAACHPMATLLHCDIVGFSRLAESLPPKDIVTMVDHLHVVIDEALADPSIFIVNRHTDGCIAACGLVKESECGQSETSWRGSAVSNDLHSSSCIQQAAVLATAALKLMSLSTKVNVPQASSKEDEGTGAGLVQPLLQLRIALHSDKVVGGIAGLNQSTNVDLHRVLKYRLFGPAIDYVRMLCTNGLALQIRVSKECHQLLKKEGTFAMEKSPDVHRSNGQVIETYWLLWKDGLDIAIPSLEAAVPLNEYDLL